MNKIITIPLMISLVSCIYISPKPVYDVSFEFERCRVRCYDFNKLTILPDIRCGEGFVSGNYALNKCEGLVGVSVRDYASYLKPKVLENIQYCNDKNDYP